MKTEEMKKERGEKEKVKNLGCDKKKMKTKIVAFVEIAIVLCSVFLVATLPAAAITNYESGITNYEEAAPGDDFVLGIYGNANEDDTIDMRDLTYVKLIFFEKKPETELADAKYDGKINPLDFIQIKLIIVGKEKEITVVDSADRTVTVKKPVERIVFLNDYVLETARSLNLEQYRVVGVLDSVTEEPLYFPEFKDTESVGGWQIDYEAVLGQHPDLVFIWTWETAKHAEKLTGVSVVGLDCYKPMNYVDETRKIGYIIDKKEETEEFIDFYQGWMNTIKEQVDALLDEDKPKVYFESQRYHSCGPGSGWHEKIEMAGGNNIFSDSFYAYPEVDPEEVIERNPEIIALDAGWQLGSWTLIGADQMDLKGVRDEIMSRPELERVSAVENEKVYVLYAPIFGEVRNFVGIGYLAKWFHPELFEALDPKAFHQEYLTRFQGLPDDFLDTHGVFAYPEPS